jgi:hypothetical protein
LVRSTNVDAFCVHAGMGGDWSNQVVMHLVSSLAWDVFGPKCWDTFCVFAGMRRVWSIHVEMHFLSSSLAYVMFVQHIMLR